MLLLRGPCPSAAAAAPSPAARRCARRRVAAAPPGVRPRLRPPRVLGRPEIENPELLIGDVVAVVSFSLYKEISSIVLSPDFPGWFAPLSLSPGRFWEFLSFAATTSAAWALAAALTGGLTYRASRNVPDALRAACWAWLVSMPVAAAQLVLLTAAESGALVGTEGFAAALPLAARGAGEPVATAAGLLGVMCCWRALYAVWLDPWSAARQQIAAEAQALREALAAAAALAALGGAALQVARAVGGLGDGPAP
ncbi:hypothetical protein Rsub_03703 [Raphidocelis subcapitata]|uniref:Uncharacterized protein n=1 Tax=Raphidocelis subcapitata TaxID=307507 RepID=A0A2V0NU53_9CHLO|nr:hypothetical protein Rsub_03703 [Raphidocelis subcapitata]|eukprot:GBF90849.1 hypothetical protein Rsub_03703 [Raphidocelis subcapitata]